MRNKPNKGSPREGASIEGLDSEESTSNPADQVGSKVENRLHLLLLLASHGSWMSSECMEVMLQHASENDQEEMAKAIYPLIKEERKALLASYPRVGTL